MSWKRSIQLVLLGLLLTLSWCAVFATCVIVLLDVLQLIGPVSLVGLVGLPFVAFGGPPLLFYIARVGLHGLESAHHEVQISPYLPPKETARALRDSLLSYRVCSWSDLLENLWETQETPIDLGLRRSRVEVYVHPAAYCFEGGNIERYSRLSKEARNGGDLAVTATLWLKIIPLPPVTLRARAQFCLSKDNVIVSDADPFLIAILK